jgi:hypothetical protein
MKYRFPSLTRNSYGIPLRPAANLDFPITRLDLEAVILTHTEAQIFVGNRPHTPQEVSSSPRLVLPLLIAVVKIHRH